MLGPWLALWYLEWTLDLCCCTVVAASQLAICGDFSQKKLEFPKNILKWILMLLVDTEKCSLVGCILSLHSSTSLNISLLICLNQVKLLSPISFIGVSWFQKVSTGNWKCTHKDATDRPIHRHVPDSNSLFSHDSSPLYANYQTLSINGLMNDELGGVHIVGVPT